MAILPTNALSPLPSVSRDTSSASSSSNAVPVIFKRLLKFSQMDYELAAWQLTYLVVAPRRVYRNVYFHKQTKNTWARDDPAVLLLISGCLCVAALAWSIVYGYSPLTALKLSFLMIFRDFLLVGTIIATCLWFFSNTLLLDPPSHSSPSDSRVEWAYAFDVHCNAFFPLFLSLYLAQLFLAPVITKNNWVCLFAGNTLYLAAASQYVYIVYLGLNALPFLVRTNLLLFPLLLSFAAYIVSLLGFNVAKHVLDMYFGS